MPARPFTRTLSCAAAVCTLAVLAPRMAIDQQKSAKGAKAAAPSAANTEAIIASLDKASAHYADVAKQIWSFAEVGYMEEKSTALLQSELKAAGFRVTAGVAGEPTAFIAEYGGGKPVIAILGEFDALPGLSQDASAERKPVRAGAPGHGCGHHLFGTASTAAAIALKEWMTANHVTGTLRMIGTPAEEGGSGKVYMVRDGVFNDVDAVVTWHPGDENAGAGERSMANITGKFRFHGVSAHAAEAPERGRSALDGVETMNVMTNYLREHIPDQTRIHYVITNGGKAPNVVPDEAEVYYYVRHVDMNVVKDVWSRVMNAAKGAALGTGTTVDLQLIGSVYSVLPNETLLNLQQKVLDRVGGFEYTAEERAFADRIQKSEPFVPRAIEITKQIQPLRIGYAGTASSDVGDVSWVVPTVQMTAATWVPGTAAHSWQAVAAGGMSIGAKGMMVAAKTVALTAAELFASPATVAAAKQELLTKRGPTFKYETVLGTQKPQLDYRKGTTN